MALQYKLQPPGHPLLHRTTGVTHDDVGKLAMVAISDGSGKAKGAVNAGKSDRKVSGK